jgi:hypothetical protein
MDNSGYLASAKCVNKIYKAAVVLPNSYAKK